MIKKHYTGSARRARNIIWNAAGSYDFEPPFMAFFPNGTPDHYFNMVVGLVQKWLDLPRIWDFFESYAGDHRRDEFDEFLWLGLENCVYEKELPERPILEQLRRDRAERFYLEQQTLTRQQMEYQSMPVYTQQELRWSAVLGKRPPFHSGREEKMFEALRFSGALDTDGVLAAMSDFLTRFFRFSQDTQQENRRPGNALARLFLRREHRRRDRLLVRIGTGEGDHEKARQQRHEGLGRHVGPGPEDEEYIRAVFGQCSRSVQEMRILENDLCVGGDEGCRLWITRGERIQTDDRDALEVRESAERQKPAAMIQGSVTALSTCIDTILSSYFKHRPEPARGGRIRPEAAYRLPVLQDDRVFSKDGEETEPEICVDLLLDASQSRMNVQEILSAEAFILARSLVRLHIPVRVCAFRSIRSFTVLEILKDWKETDCRGLMRYFAGGWNRDALALETVGRMEDDPQMQGKQRILLVLTDASPNDSTPFSAQGLMLPREYEGAEAVKAAETAVRLLRTEGLRVGAVFHGNTTHMENVHQIYGHAYVRIQKANQLAQGVSDLLLMLMREMRDD